MAAWRTCEGCGEVSVRFDPADAPLRVVCASCATPWGTAQEHAYQWLHWWFLSRYRDPASVCPYESAEGGYQYLWGGPYSAHVVLTAAWCGVFTEPFLAVAAARLESYHHCDAWSGKPHDTEASSGLCWACSQETTLACDQCPRWLCGSHAPIRHRAGDHHGADGVDVLCAEHAVPLPDSAIEQPRA